MADPIRKMYLRFDDRAYAGHSTYRPSEGWIDVVEHEVFWNPSTVLLRKDDPAVRRYFRVVCKDPVTSLLIQAAGGQRALGNASLAAVQVSGAHKGEEMYRWIMTHVFIGDYQVVDQLTAGFYLHRRQPLFGNVRISVIAVQMGLLLPAVQKVREAARP